MDDALYIFLTKLKKKQIIEIYTNRAPVDIFITGYITALSEKQITVMRIDRYGRELGAITYKLASLIKVAHSTPYIEIITFCMKRKDVFKRTKRSANVPDRIHAELDAARLAGEPVSGSMESGGSEVSFLGFVMDLSSNWVTIREVSGMGLDDGFITLNIGIITELVRNKPDDRTLTLFNEYMHSKRH